MIWDKWKQFEEPAFGHFGFFQRWQLGVTMTVGKFRINLNFALFQSCFPLRLHENDLKLNYKNWQLIFFVSLRYVWKKKKNDVHISLVVSALAFSARSHGFDPCDRRDKISVSEYAFFSGICRDDTIDKCTVLRIKTLTGGPLCRLKGYFPNSWEGINPETNCSQMLYSAWIYQKPPTNVHLLH